MGLLIGIVFAALLLLVVAFLLQRVSHLERQARALSEKRSDKADPLDPTDQVFAAYDGQALWDLLASNSPAEGINPQVLEDARQRYAFILLNHASQLFESGARGLTDEPSNTRRIVTMRGAVQSWLPPAQAQALFECGRQAKGLTDAAAREAVRQRLMQVSQSMAPAIQAGVLLQLSDRLLPPPQQPS